MSAINNGGDNGQDLQDGQDEDENNRQELQDGQDKPGKGGGLVGAETVKLDRKG